MKKILLIRFSSIGDIVLTTPVVRALKEQSNCTLHTLTKKKYSFIYENNKHIDKVYSFEESIKECFEDLKNESYDFVVDLQKSLRSIKFCRKLGVNYESFPKLNREKWLLVNFHINKLPHKHIVDRYFEAVKPLYIDNDNKGLEYYLRKEDYVKPGSINAKLNSGFIAWAIGGQHFTKIMPSSKVTEIASFLSLPVLLLGGPADKERGEEIEKNSTNNLVINCCGKYSLNQSASLVKQAKLVLSNDTGLMHIAAAFNKPLISLWGNTVPEFGMYPYMPKNQDNFVVAEVGGLKCRPCSKLGHKQCPKKHFNCMMQQDEAMISNGALRFLKK